MFKLGEAIHPDLLSSAKDLTDDQYLEQLIAYVDWSDDDLTETFCSRPHLLPRRLRNGL